jgi:hypothetical protein
MTRGFPESDERFSGSDLHGISCIYLFGMIQNRATRNRHGSAQVLPKRKLDGLGSTHGGY